MNAYLNLPVAISPITTPARTLGKIASTFRARHSLVELRKCKAAPIAELFLAEQLGISEISAQLSPKQKVAPARAETAKIKPLYLGEGLHDATATITANVIMAFGHDGDATADVAGVVVVNNFFDEGDEFMRISGRVIAAAEPLDPISGAITREVIYRLAVLNALRAALPRHGDL
jgi:hypothetical protein